MYEVTSLLFRAQIGILEEFKKNTQDLFKNYENFSIVGQQYLTAVTVKNVTQCDTV
jgi:hypothetical protein